MICFYYCVIWYFNSMLFLKNELHFSSFRKLLSLYCMNSLFLNIFFGLSNAIMFLDQVTKKVISSLSKIFENVILCFSMFWLCWSFLRLRLINLIIKIHFIWWRTYHIRSSNLIFCNTFLNISPRIDSFLGFRHLNLFCYFHILCQIHTVFLLRRIGIANIAHIMIGETIINRTFFAVDITVAIRRIPVQLKFYFFDV